VNLNGIYADPIGHWVVVVAAMLGLLFVLLTAAAYTVLFERVTLGRLQRRPGPNRVGPYGLLQSAADALKAIFKESVIPRGADRVVYVAAPAVAVVMALLAWAVIPVGVWYGVYYWVAGINIGVLFIFALSAMNVYAIMLGGYSSNSKYSLLGGLRSAAQLISYEVALGLALVPTFMIVGSLRLQDIAAYHFSILGFDAHWPLVFLTPIGFVIFVLASVAETNRAPFDLAEAEQELVGGFHTEYSTFRWLLYMIAEYTNMITVAALATVLFLGAWWGGPIPPLLVYLVKVVLFLFFYVWVRATLPRLRYDMLMRLGWKVLLPLGILNVVVTAIVLVAAQG
jgi:NADH-quinone oxidoreductase subunit H